MAQCVQIVGSYLSPYVRKVLVVLDLKGIHYEIDPIVPFFGDDRFSEMSPLREFQFSSITTPRWPTLLSSASTSRIAILSLLSIPPTSLTALVHDGSKNTPIRAWERCSSGSYSTKS